MKLVPFALAAPALTACAAMLPPPFPPSPQPPRSLEPPPVIRPMNVETHDLVTANADAHRVLAALRAADLTMAPSDVSLVDLLAGAPGYAWQVGPEYLHIHVYRDRPAAAAAAQRFVTTAMSRSQIIDWVGRPHLFNCGTALTLYLGERPEALSAIAATCGPPVWAR